MLNQIHIRNFTIIDEVDVELEDGMSALTGETGAGKSILVDALGLVLGDRADNQVIRHGCERAEIAADFDIHSLPGIAAWLASRELDASGECQLRRVITRAGRSRGYINSQPVPLQSLRELGEQLVDIHGQHEHQSLLKSAVQRQLLDASGGHVEELQQVARLYDEWKAASEALDSVTRTALERDARLDLLRYQSQELESLGLTAEEIESLDEEHARLANAGQLMQTCRQSLTRLYDSEESSAYQLISQALNDLNERLLLDRKLKEPARLLNEILVLLQEGADELRHYVDQLELDPERLQQVEERIATLHELARKHRCKPGDLPLVMEKLCTELGTLEHADQQRSKLQARVAEFNRDYQEAAQKLSRKRVRTAQDFSRKITAAMQSLGMPGGIFAAEVETDNNGPFRQHGLDRIEFRVSANPGQPPLPLTRVVSGGELSRISLAIQVIAATSDTRPTLIFDEVDSGIGGGVAEIVGHHLRSLGANRQVLCVTHLPQVAALAAHQLQVTKLSGDDSTRTRIRSLNAEERVDELARMLGGVKITRQTQEHAREMLQSSRKTAQSDRKKKKAT